MITRFALACGAAAILTIALAGDSPEFQAQSETTWTKSFTEQSSFGVDSMLQMVNGQEVQAPELEMEGTTAREVVLVDECLAAEEGRAMNSKRRFETIESRSTMSLAAMDMQEDHQVELSGLLTGIGLRCDWSDGDYEFRFDEDEEGESTWLEGLSEDADYQLLLPDEEVEVGDSWVVDLSEGQDLFAPGGRLGMKLDDAASGSFNLLDREDVVLVAMISLAELCEDMEGEVTATWSETREVDGRQLAVIQLELEVELEADLAEEFSELTSGGTYLQRDELVFEVKTALEGKGELLWDLEGDHFRSFELECESTYEIELSWMMDFGEVAVEVEASGTSKLAAEAAKE